MTQNDDRLLGHMLMSKVFRSINASLDLEASLWWSSSLLCRDSHYGSSHQTIVVVVIEKKVSLWIITKTLGNFRIFK